MDEKLHKNEVRLSAKATGAEDNFAEECQRYGYGQGLKRALELIESEMKPLPTREEIRNAPIAYSGVTGLLRHDDDYYEKEWLAEMWKVGRVNNVLDDLRTRISKELEEK